MRAELALAVTTLIASPAFAGSEERPDGPKKEFFRGLQRPDASPRASEFERSCCGPGDVVKTNSNYFRPIAVTRKTLGSRGSTKDGSRSHRKRSCQTLRLMGRPIYSCCTSGTKLIGRHPAMTW